MAMVALAALLVIGATAGCNPEEEAAEEIIEQTTGGDVEIDDDGESVTIETEDGSMEITGGDGAAVPDGFPDDMPLYEGTIVLGQMMETPEGTAYNVGVETTDGAYEVADWYADEMASAGWTTTSELTNEAEGAIIVTRQAEKDGVMAQVVIAEEDGLTQIAVTVAAE
jgi:hypothetical protein